MTNNILDIENETLYRLWLHNIPGIYNSDMNALLSYYNSVSDLYQAALSCEVFPCINADKHSLLFSNTGLESAKCLYDRLTRDNINIIFPGHPNYPDKLINISNPPQILYIKGELPDSINDIHSNIAMVGSRFPDSYGREYAYMFAKKLSSYGINIISGLAKGIDGCSHRGALSSDGFTIAVLGCGINQIYPRENYKLYMDISLRGAIISEYPPNAIPLSFQFPERNRIISGLSDGVLVVEAKRRSGSLITCNYALEQGKPVFAIPGRIGDALSEGTNSLIYDGAICTTSPDDITDILFNKVTDRTECDTHMESNFTHEEQKILEVLSLYDMHIDDIVEKSHLGVTKTINTLLLLKEKGVVKESSKGYYIKTVIL